MLTMNNQQLIDSILETDPIALPVTPSGSSSTATDPITAVADEAEDQALAAAARTSNPALVGSSPAQRLRDDQALAWVRLASLASDQASPALVAEVHGGSNTADKLIQTTDTPSFTAEREPSMTQGECRHLSLEKSNLIDASTSTASSNISVNLAIPTDTLLSQQWHLGNTGGLLDLNVRKVWNPTAGIAYTGAGTRTVVIDDGFDYNHQDFDNYDQTLDFDFDQSDLDPFGTSSNAHGTAVAGIIGAAADGTGAVGVAYGTSLVGYRTNGYISDFWLRNIRDAIHHAAMSASADLANISQGIANDASSEFGFGYDAIRFDEIETSIGTAVDNGRGGLGMTIIKSAGNSRADNYDVNADDWTNDTRQVVVAAVNQDGFVSTYSSYGAALLVSGFGTPGQVVTTDRSGSAGYNSTDFTSSFNGTSSAAPMVSGVVALMVDANTALGWRDVQTILGVSARQVGSEVGAVIAGSERYGWQFNAASTWNGGGQHFSNDYGYGLVDAHAAVRLAETWLLTGTEAATSSNEFTNTIDVLNSSVVIPDGNFTGTNFSGTALYDDIVERVTVQMTFSTTFLADVELYLTSPDGTVSELIDDVAGGADFNGTWTFESQAFRGERAAGSWTVRVVDDMAGDALTVSDIVIRTFGAFTSDDRYIYTDEYSDYNGVFSHATSVADSNGGTDTVNASAVSTSSTIRLDGGVGTIDGVGTTFSNIENAIGGDGNDIIVGSDGNNLLVGMRGNDTLNGGDGTDTLRGEAGNDVLIQSFGGPNEILDGGEGNDTGDWSYSTINSWSISLVAGTALIGSTVFAQLTSIENVIGGQLTDTIIGNDFNNVLDGQAGNDSLSGGTGNDSLSGGTGNDTLNGGDGTDTLRGEAGNDVLTQSFGGPNEILDGGEGDDTGDWSYSTIDSWSISLVAGTALIGSTVFAQLTSIENVIGGQLTDIIIGNGLNNVLDGQAGNDSLSGGTGNDTLNGGDGTDTLRGEAGNDVLTQSFGGPNEILDGGEGNDTGDWSYSTIDSWTISLVAGTALIGSTVFAQLTSIENVIGGQLTDTIIGNGLNNVLDGQAGNDSLSGGTGNDSLSGGAGIDSLDGGAGIDTLNGGSGNDFYMVDSTTDVIQETSTLSTEIDTVQSSVTFSLNTTNLANMENLTLIGTTAINGTGNARNNVLTGNSANNSLSGGTGNDTLDGGAGIDTLNGGSGNDTLSGGAGGDFFRFDSALNGSTNVDRVTDFSIADNDCIQLENTGTGLFTAITATGTLALTAFVIGTAFTNTVQRIRYDSNIGNLFYDSDGSGAAASILFCTLDGGLGLTNNQFQVT